MALATSFVLALLAQGAPAAVDAPETSFDVGYEELVEGRDRAAVEAIEACAELEADDPARLINLGVALARMGQFDEARADFEAAAEADSSVELETADGHWVDSRRLARRALAALDRGDFARYYAMSMR